MLCIEEEEEKLQAGLEQQFEEGREHKVLEREKHRHHVGLGFHESAEKTDTKTKDDKGNVEILKTTILLILSVISKLYLHNKLANCNRVSVYKFHSEYSLGES